MRALTRFLIWIGERVLECGLGAFILTIVAYPNTVQGIDSFIFGLVLMFFYIVGGYSLTSFVVLALSYKKSPRFYIVGSVIAFSLTYIGLSIYITVITVASGLDGLWLCLLCFIPSILVVAACSAAGRALYSLIYPPSVTPPQPDPI